MKLLITATAGIASVLFLAGCGNSSGPGAPPLNSPPPPTTVQTLGQWEVSPGYLDLQAVYRDVSQIVGDAGVPDYPALAADGQSLVADAQSAQANPPPVDTSDYQTTMSDFIPAGNELSQGNWQAGYNYLQAGTTAAYSFYQSAPGLPYPPTGGVAGPG